MPTLEEFGWSTEWATAFEGAREKDTCPARVTAVHASMYEIMSTEGPRDAALAGKLRYKNLYSAKNPSVGDWVAAYPNPLGAWTIVGVLKRKTCLQRQEAGGIAAQVIGANIDKALLIQAVDRDYNIARLDRYMAVVRDAGIVPVVVLTKADKLSEAELVAKVGEVKSSFPGVLVVPISSLTGYGISDLRDLLAPGQTHVAIGSSGVGKSTLLNLLAGDKVMPTQEVRADDQRGRHTTTHRQMFRLPCGALFIDTPGMREMGLFSFEGVDEAFLDIAEIARECKFRNCTHHKEPGCAVRKALRSGQLSQGRWESYIKLQNEETFFQEKQILLTKQMSNARKKRKKVHYKDHMRGASREIDDHELAESN